MKPMYVVVELLNEDESPVNVSDVCEELEEALEVYEEWREWASPPDSSNSHVRVYRLVEVKP